MKPKSNELLFIGLLFQWFCLWHKEGLAYGLPYADHRRNNSPGPILIPPNRDSLIPKSDDLFTSYPVSTTKLLSIPSSQEKQLIGTLFQNQPEGLNDYGNPNFNFQPPLSLDPKRAYMTIKQLTNMPVSTPVPLLFERDGPPYLDRQIPELLLINQQSLKTSENQEIQKAQVDAHIPYFTVMANTENQPDNMRDYALLDETEDTLHSSLTPTLTTPMPPKLMKPQATPTPLLMKPHTTQTPKLTLTKTTRWQTTPPTNVKPTSKYPLRSSALYRLQATTTAPRHINSIPEKPVKRQRQRNNTNMNLMLPSKNRQLREHREHKRSPQQDRPISYVPAFRRRQTATNIYNNVADHNFAHSAVGHTLTDGYIPQTPAFQNIPYNYYSNLNAYGGYAPPFNSFQNSILPYGQFSPLTGGQLPNVYSALSSGFPNLAISYQIPLFAPNSVFPPYLSGNYNGFNGFNQGSFVSPFQHGPENFGAANSLFPPSVYPFTSNAFTNTFGPTTYPDTFLTRNDIRQKNGTNFRVTSNELDSLNGFTDSHRQSANGRIQPNSNGFLPAIYAGFVPQLQPANPSFPLPLSNPSTFGFPVNNQSPFVPNPPPAIGPIGVQSAFPQELPQPIFRDNTGLGNVFPGIQNGPFSTPEVQSSFDDSLDFPPQDEKTILNETQSTSTEGTSGDEDAQRFKPISGDKGAERPNAETTATLSPNESGRRVAENPQVGTFGYN